MTDVRPAIRLTRELVDRLPPRIEEELPIPVPRPDDVYYEHMADTVLESVGHGDLWVFAIGSLIWNPRFEVVERRAARASGWRRAFTYYDTWFRGNPQAPGRMLTLEPGEGECWGMVLKMTPIDRRTQLIGLLKKEPPFPPEWLDLHTDGGGVRAMAFTANLESPTYSAEPPVEDVADMLARSVGNGGTMAEYVLNTVTELDAAGLYDPYLWRLQELIAERLERMPVVGDHKLVG